MTGVVADDSAREREHYVEVKEELPAARPSFIADPKRGGLKKS